MDIAAFHNSTVYLHGVGLPRSCLTIGKDANVEAVNAGRNQRLNFLEHLLG